MKNIEWLGDKKGEGILYRIIGEAYIPKGLVVYGGPPYSIKPRKSPVISLLEGGDKQAALLVAESGGIAVTVGMTGVDCVTYSSSMGDKCVIAVEREFETLTGKIVPVKEIALRCATCGVAELLACTAALVLGFDISGCDIV